MKLTTRLPVHESKTTNHVVAATAKANSTAAMTAPVPVDPSGPPSAALTRSVITPLVPISVPSMSNRQKPYG